MDVRLTSVREWHNDAVEPSETKMVVIHNQFASREMSYYNCYNQVGIQRYRDPEELISKWCLAFVRAESAEQGQPVPGHRSFKITTLPLSILRQLKPISKRGIFHCCVDLSII